MDTKKETAAYFQGLIESVQYDGNTFTMWYSEDKVIVGALLTDNPEAERFFDYATIYNTIIDTDAKIKYSLYEAIKWIDDIDFEKWNPLQAPSNEEYKAIYYTENAVFRTSVLWDLLAQLFNIKAGIGKPFDKVYTSQLFHDAQQGRRANQFAKKVYEYMEQADNLDVEPWEGNHKYVKDFRDKMTHRASPNVSSFSNFAVEVRIPSVYVLKRVIEDYVKVSEFIQELIIDILKDYEMLNNADLLEGEKNNA